MKPQKEFVIIQTHRAFLQKNELERVSNGEAFGKIVNFEFHSLNSLR